MKHCLIIIFLCLINISLFSQRETNNWYFGDSAGVSFNSGYPIPLKDGKIKTWEGVASMSDTLGNLLFYTEGTTVWNAKHQIMSNGSDLKGHYSSTESAIIIPKPDDDNIYYIFTVDWQGKPNGLMYSELDMSLNSGLGDITSTKNIKLLSPVSEKVTAVKHRNNKDIWVITHKWKSDAFYSYLVTETGVNTTPVISIVGTRHNKVYEQNINTLGYLRASPNGKKLALALMVDQLFEIYDFDNSTGKISNPITISATGGSAYGIEFSPDCSKAYLVSGISLHQIDLNAGSNQNIKDSYTFIGISESSRQPFGAIQIASDGKIYMAHDRSNYLCVINKPNKKGSLCEFKIKGFYLGGRKSRLGLPNFIQTYFSPPSFTVNNNCVDAGTQFTISDLSGVESVLWNFGDNGQDNTSKDISPTYKYSKKGVYTVNLLIYNNGDKYYSKSKIQVNPLPEISLGNDTTICINDTLTLKAYGENITYKWFNSTELDTTYVSKTNDYWIDATSIYTGCVNRYSKKVTFAPLPQASLGNDTSICVTDSIELNVNREDLSFLWSNGNTADKYVVKNKGEYWLEYTDIIGCKNRDTIAISINQLPVFSIGVDTILCKNTNIVLKSNIAGEKYLWSDNSINSNYTINNAGTHWLELTDINGCKDIDTININNKEILPFSFGKDTCLCEETSLSLFAPQSDAEYSWNNSSTDFELIVRKKGTYWLETRNICGVESDTISVSYKYCGEVVIPNIFTPNNDGVNDIFSIKGIDTGKWELEIINRWGRKVYYSSEYKNDWSPTNIKSGIYYYILINYNNNLSYKGYFHIY